MNENTTLAAGTYDAMAQSATDKADAMIASTRRAADDALDSLQDKANNLASVAPSTLSRVAAQVDELTRNGVERAKAATDLAREQATRAGDRTVSYIKDEPVKAVLIAALAGAGIAALIGLLNRAPASRRS